MLQLTEATFSQIDSEPVAVVDFWAPWCGPCRAMATAFEKLAGEHSDVMFAKVNTDEYNGLAAVHHIGALPTIIVFKNGKEFRRWEGMPPVAQLKEALGAI